jgi:hypothetical protein
MFTWRKGAERPRARPRILKEPLSECAKRVACYAWLAAASIMFCGAPMLNAQRVPDTQKSAPAKTAENPIKAFFRAAFSIDGSVGDLKFVGDKGSDGADYVFLKSLFERFENGKLNLDSVDVSDMTSEVKKEIPRVLKCVSLKIGIFEAHLNAEANEDGTFSVSLLSFGAFGINSGRFYVSEIIVPKECEVSKCEPFFVSNAKDVAELGIYIKYKDKRDGKTYQLMMKVAYAKTAIGTAKTSIALRQMNDTEIGIATYINRQIGARQ